MGMYASGIPIGLITDRVNPRLSAIIGMFALLVGYYPIKMGMSYIQASVRTELTFNSLRRRSWVHERCYDILLFFCYWRGQLCCVSGCFEDRCVRRHTPSEHLLIPPATLNWPTHRGSATAFPLAAFGLSAFFYTLIAGIAFPGNTSGLLTMLSLATSLLVLVSIPFLIVVDHKSGTSYAVLPTNERTRRNSNVLHRTNSNRSKYSATVLPPQEVSKFYLFSCTVAIAYIFPLPYTNRLQQMKMTRADRRPKLLRSFLALETLIRRMMLQADIARSHLTHTV